MSLAVRDLLTDVQRLLRDPNGNLWTRAELLRHLNDGYRRLLAESRGARRLTILSVPPRYGVAVTYPWERRHVGRGSWRQWTFGGPQATRQCTALWELEQYAGNTPTDGYTTVTQLWEKAYASGTTDTDYRFALPRDHERIKAVWWDHKPLSAFATKSLDATEEAWNRAAGEPWVFMPGFGESRSFEIYHIRTEYTADYEARLGRDTGMVRALSGDRTYEATASADTNGYAYTTQADSIHLVTRKPHWFPRYGLRITTDPTPNPGGQYQSTYLWEQERHEGATTFTDGETVGTYAWEAAYGAENVVTQPLGLLRRLQSPERQYLTGAEWNEPLGLIRRFQSSEDNLLVHESVIPDTPVLTELDTPKLVPAPLLKYLKYYVLYCAFNRQGEGYRPDLASHWAQRWQRGPQLLRKLADCTWADVRHQRMTQRPFREGRLARSAPLPPEYGDIGA